MRIKKVISATFEKIYKNPRPSLNDIDRKLEKYLNFQNGFFIEAGANDGYQQSNTYFLENKRGWNGILVEGIPQLYEKAKKSRKGSTVFNCALVSKDYPHSTIEMHYADLMSVVDGALKSKKAQNCHLAKGVDIQNLKVSYSITVPTNTLESILDKFKNLPAIDFLSLDVEGYELNALKGINLSKYRPKYILVEARFFEEVNTFLNLHSYKMVEKLSVHDVLYKVS